jgi:hypothetical protein
MPKRNRRRAQSRSISGRRQLLELLTSADSEPGSLGRLLFHVTAMASRTRSIARLSG